MKSVQPSCRPVSKVIVSQSLTFALWLIAGVFSAEVASTQTQPTFDIEDNRLKLPAAIEFETGTATIQPTSTASLDHIKAYLDAKSYITTLRIEGHVCCGTSDVDAQKLSEQRALAIAAYLVSKGVDCKRLLPVGFGPTKPIADGTTPEGRAQNNRIEIKNAALKDRPIGGMPTDGGGKVAGDPCAGR